MIYFDHVHRLFRALNPHAAENVRPLIDSDEWAMTLSENARAELEADVRSLDPSNLGGPLPALAFERTATFRVEASSLAEAEKLWDENGPECGEGIYVTWEGVVRPIPDYCAKHGYPLDDGCGGRQECAKCAQETQ